LSIWAGVLTITTGFDLVGFHFTEREEAMTEYIGFSFLIRRINLGGCFNDYNWF
jgi:hypothetical protein